MMLHTPFKYLYGKHFHGSFYKYLFLKNNNLIDEIIIVLKK